MAKEKYIPEKELWGIIEMANWAKDNNYNRIAKEFNKLPAHKVEKLKEFIYSKHKELNEKFEKAWLGEDGGKGIDVSDDGWSDLRAEVIGRGEKFYNSITKQKLQKMANHLDYTESFLYCLHDVVGKNTLKEEKEKSSWKKELGKIKQCPQRQDSLTDQLRDLAIIANKFGFYDAADMLKRF